LTRGKKSRKFSLFFSEPVSLEKIKNRLSNGKAIAWESGSQIIHRQKPAGKLFCAHEFAAVR
jgi:hypothetical protein